MSDDTLYAEGMRRLEDLSLLHWYARLPMPARHRLLAVTNARHDAAHVDAHGEWLYEQGTLASVLQQLIVSPYYKAELAQIEQTLHTKLARALEHT